MATNPNKPVAPTDPIKLLITRVDNSLSLVASMGPSPCKITDGFQGWETVARPHKQPLTLYKGRNPFGMQLNLMFDGFINDVSQEPALQRLTWLALVPQGLTQPMPVFVYGRLPYPATSPWVIQNIEYGDNVIWSSVGGAGVRLRQDVTVTLMQYIRPDVTAFEDPGQGPGPHLPTTHTTHDGDTWRSLAFFYYHDYTKWYIIAQANAVTAFTHPNPTDKLPIPGTLRIPALSTNG